MLAGCGAKAAATASVPPTPAVHNRWTWVGGSNTGGALGDYGIQGTAADNNVPGARSGAVSWIDKSGSLWLFGGVQGEGLFNDLWKYSGGHWTWVDGSEMMQQSGIYGTQGVASTANVPGARSNAVSWADGQGNLWLFGGEGMDSLGRDGLLNDLWRYAGGEWTFMSGSNLGTGTLKGGRGLYGTQGVASLTNTPGPRSGASSWVDSSGNLWLFGGDGADSNGQFGDLNDLWKYNGGEWTWMTGENVGNPISGATYGTLGVPALANTPGARHGAVTWTDSSGNLWLFGGDGFDSVGQYGLLNDLWKYSAGQWSWMAGSNVNNVKGTYGILGATSANGLPGGRQKATTWIGADGTLWLFGGGGFDSVGAVGDLNDLWKFSGNQWVWVSGSNVIEQTGVYGTKGVSAAGNVPQSRQQAISWMDSSGNLWLFGGQSALPTQYVELNDLWEYQP